MSNWTHVAGIIRVDSLERVLLGKSADFTRLIGTLPYGSEGALKMTVWENPGKGSLAGYTVSIFGDLRDHDSAEEIIEWFKNVCTKLSAQNLSIRNATVTADNSFNGSSDWTYREDFDIGE